MAEEVPTATDPVCAMTVEIEAAAVAGLTAQDDEITFYFCSKGCKFDFDEDPKKYLDPGYTPAM